MTMKAVRIMSPGPAKSLVYESIPKPTLPSASVLVKNKFSGVNFIDTYFRTGVYPTPMPTVLGEEGSGVIEKVGSDVKDFAVGDRVAYITRTASYAEYTIPDDRYIKKIPDSVSFELGAASMTQGLTAICLTNQSYKVKKGDIVLIHAAAGGTGRLFVQICKHYGATVIATVSTEEKADIVRKLGADNVILYTQEDVPTKVREFTNGKMADVVFDGVGKSTFQASFDSLRRCGTLVSFGNASGKVPPIEINMLSKGNIVLLRPQLYGYLTTREEFETAATELFDLIAKKVLDINICKIFDLKDAEKAHEFIEARKTTGKILLRIDDK
ncbi:hypothetical protein BB560_003048 [Smittium megazygosporum]|uniref:Probable quinone oxidoreductase n=1 Tax=Smittium megazygosporum TaxID=133381 RepID=A0A2T9ZD29_9FUNG|nr:hypothetical protein BB560_003048 [Smittium megazygosporum]